MAKANIFTRVKELEEDLAFWQRLSDWFSRNALRVDINPEKHQMTITFRANSNFNEMPDPVKAAFMGAVLSVNKLNQLQKAVTDLRGLRSRMLEILSIWDDTSEGDS